MVSRFDDGIATGHQKAPVPSNRTDHDTGWEIGDCLRDWTLCEGTLRVDPDFDDLGLIVLQQGNVQCILITGKFDDLLGSRSPRVHRGVDTSVLEQVHVFTVIDDCDRPVDAHPFGPECGQEVRLAILIECRDDDVDVRGSFGLEKVPGCRVRIADSRRREAFGQFACAVRVCFQQVRAKPPLLEQLCSVISDIAPPDNQDVSRGLSLLTEFGAEGMD